MVMYSNLTPAMSDLCFFVLVACLFSADFSQGTKIKRIKKWSMSLRGATDTLPSGQKGCVYKIHIPTKV